MEINQGVMLRRWRGAPEIQWPHAGTDAVERALERSGRALGGKAVTVARSLRTGKQAEHDDDGGGAVFDQLNNRLYPHDVPEAHLDFKKRRIMYPKDHDR